MCTHSVSVRLFALSLTHTFHDKLWIPSGFSYKFSSSAFCFVHSFLSVNATHFHGLSGWLVEKSWRLRIYSCTDDVHRSEKVFEMSYINTVTWIVCIFPHYISLSLSSLCARRHIESTQRGFRSFVGNLVCLFVRSGARGCRWWHRGFFDQSKWLFVILSQVLYPFFTVTIFRFFRQILKLVFH